MAFISDLFLLLFFVCLFFKNIRLEFGRNQAGWKWTDLLIMTSVPIKAASGERKVGYISKRTVNSHLTAATLPFFTPLHSSTSSSPLHDHNVTLHLQRLHHSGRWDYSEDRRDAAEQNVLEKQNEWAANGVNEYRLVIVRFMLHQCVLICFGIRLVLRAPSMK